MVRDLVVEKWPEMPYIYVVTPPPGHVGGACAGNRTAGGGAAQTEDQDAATRVRIIDTGSELDRLAAALQGEPLVAADSEAAGFHRYHDRICLLQLSTRSETFLLDTLALDDLGGIADVLGDPDRETVFHDADYDLRLLDRDFGVKVRGLFDTKIAAQFVGEPALGLASVLKKHVGVVLEKKHQRADWARRPLPREMLEYAATDTRHLPALRDALGEALDHLGRVAWAEEEFRLQEQRRWTSEADDGNAFLRIKGTRDLGPRQLAALRELHRWREERGRSEDRATFRIMPNTALVALARALPADLDGLRRVDGVADRPARRYGEALLDALERARGVPERELPERPVRPRRPPPDPALEARVERLKQVRDRRSEALGLDRGFLMPRSQLEQVAREAPMTTEELAALPGMRRWQVEALGGPLLDALDNGVGA